MIHPARSMPFDDLLSGLMTEVEAENVRRKYQPSTGLSTYCYSEQCTYERAWNEYSLVARGLVLDEAARAVVATPFPKFFNLNERGEGFSDIPFEVFEKLDGSLIIIFWHGGKWCCATKGSFESDQAKWAQARLDAANLSVLVPGATYLAEAVYPENRIVVRYAEAALVMLAAYAGDGTEMTYAAIHEACAALGWRPAKRYAFGTISELIVTASTLTSQEEGFVVRFENGHRIKVKGDEYRRVHSLISHCTPLAMWEAMAAGDDMDVIRRDLPEEFWLDFDAIIAILSSKVRTLVNRVAEVAEQVEGLSAKELGLSLDQQPEDVRPFLFAWRNCGGKLDSRAMEKVFRVIRPTANRLDGYTPSYAMNRVLEDADG